MVGATGVEAVTSSMGTSVRTRLSGIEIVLTCCVGTSVWIAPETHLRRVTGCGRRIRYDPDVLAWAV
jgi:hypothetical protein